MLVVRNLLTSAKVNIGSVSLEPNETILLPSLPPEAEDAIRAGSIEVTSLTNTTRLYDHANGQRIAIQAAATVSGAINAREVLLIATSACYVKSHADPTAGNAAGNAAGNFYMTAGEKFHMQLASGHKIGCIRDTADGGLFILPVLK
jgi:hypothetical protein